MESNPYGYLINQQGNDVRYKHGTTIKAKPQVIEINPQTMTQAFYAQPFVIGNTLIRTIGREEGRVINYRLCDIVQSVYNDLWKVILQFSHVADRNTCSA